MKAVLQQCLSAFILIPLTSFRVRLLLSAGPCLPMLLAIYMLLKNLNQRDVFSSLALFQSV